MLNKGEIVAIYLDGGSLAMVAKAVKIPISTARLIIKSAGALRSRADGIRLAAEQGRLGASLRGRTRVLSDETCRRMSESARLRWDGLAAGVSTKPSGYVEYTTGPHKGRRVHVVAIEAQLGRRLAAHEVVHHKDGVRSNNEPSNLELMTRKDHSRHHALLIIQSRKRDTKGRLC